MMKLSMTLCASFVALVAFTLAAEGEVSFTFHKIDWDYHASNCKRDGGVVVKKDGQDTCKISSATAAPATDVQDNAVADTGKTATPKGDEKATARWVTEDRCDGTLARAKDDKGSATEGAGDGTRGGSHYNDCANKAAQLRNEKHQ